MRKIPERTIEIDQTEDTIFANKSTVSENECTGIAPLAIESEADAESYGELYAIHKPQRDSGVETESR